MRREFLKRTPEEDRVLATHEAGHAVTGRGLGFHATTLRSAQLSDTYCWLRRSRGPFCAKLGGSGGSFGIGILLRVARALSSSCSAWSKPYTDLNGRSSATSFAAASLPVTYLRLIVV